MTGIKDGWRRWLKAADSAALAGMGILGAVITAVALIESYGNLYDYALLAGLAGWRARIAPLAVDTLILTGELLLFTAIARAWERRVKAYGWLLVAAGFALSVAGNVGHLHQAGWQTRVTSALWPSVATAGLAAGLMALKRVSDAYQAKPAAAIKTINRQVSGPPAGQKPGLRRGGRAGRPQVQVPLPDGALAAAAAARVSSRQLVPWLAERYPDAVIPEISRYKAGELLKTARLNGHAG